MSNHYQMADESFLLRDFEDEYFNSSLDLFLNYLNRFRSFKRKLSKSEEKELRFMLDTLIETKNRIEEEKIIE